MEEFESILNQYSEGHIKNITSAPVIQLPIISLSNIKKINTMSKK